MSMHTPQGPRQGGASAADVAALVSALWRFVTRTWIGAILAIALVVYLLFNFALFAAPRVTLMMAQNKSGESEEQKESDGSPACYVIVVEANDVCLGDAGLPAADGDLAGSESDATPASILLPSSDGYFPSVYGLTVKIWKAAVDQAVDPSEAARRKCIAQIITDRFGERNTFAAFSGDASEHNAIAPEIGLFSWPVVRLRGPDYTVQLKGLSFAPLMPERVKDTCAG
jgi:hypothetical protein